MRMSDKAHWHYRSKSPYTKEFEEYYARVDSYLLSGTEPWVSDRVKRIAFNAFKAGKRKAKLEVNET